MSSLTKKQLEFIKNEFKIENVDYSNTEMLNDIRLKCFDIETDECYDQHMNGEDTASSIGERGDIAVSIIDTLYDIIHAEK